MRRAQQAIEFLTLISVVIMLVIGVLVFITNQTEKLDIESSKRFMEVSAKNIDQEIKNLISSPTNVIRNFTVIDTDGSLKLINGNELVFNDSVSPYIIFYDFYVNGQPCEGINTLSRFENIVSVCCNCNGPQVTLPNALMCLDDPFSWSPCRNMTNATTLNSLISQCPNGTVVSQFNVTNTTHQLVYENATTSVDGWFFLDTNFSVPSDGWNISARCLDENGSILIELTDDNGTIVTPVTNCTEIKFPGNYKLQNDIAVNGTCIVVNSDNVKFDGDDYRLTGNGTGYGVSSDNNTNVTIQYTEMFNFYHGIYLDSVANFYINDNSIGSSIYGNFNGSGTLASPYEITDCNRLQDMRYNLDSDYILMNDIDCSDTINWNDGKGFKPIGNITDRFIGSFNGKNYTISDLYINRTFEFGMALFGVTNTSAFIHDVGLINVDITGSAVIGGLVAFNYGIINRTFVTGSIKTSGPFAGLIAGWNYGYVENTHVYGDVSGMFAIGGAIGISQDPGIIRDTYANVNISCTLSSPQYGCGGLIGNNGLVGSIAGGSVINSFVDAEINSIISNTNGLVGTQYNGVITNSFFNNKTSSPDRCSNLVLAAVNCTAIDDDESYFFNSLNPPMNSWDFSDVWTEWKYPVLKNMVGEGTLEYPFEIKTCTELQAMENKPNAHYILINDIDCSETIGWNDGKGFLPINASDDYFYGTLRGDNHIISNLFINDSASPLISGIFRRLAFGAVISNTILTNFYIEGYQYVGGIAGGNEGEIKGSSIHGNIRGFRYVGGMVGENKGIIKKSYVFGNITATSFIVGGVVGTNHGNITDVYSVVNVSSLTSVFVSGIAGVFAKGNITNVYSVANISAASGIGIGGLVGHKTAGSQDMISNSFAVARIIGSFLPGGGVVGYNQTPGSVTINTYWYDFAGDDATRCIGITAADCAGEVASPDDFFDFSQAPLNTWNFNGIWEEQTDGYPTLRQTYGLGTSYDPFKIYDCEGLQDIRNNLTAHYVLMNDIDCSDTINWNSGKGFIPIGTIFNIFLGEFNGRNHTISDLYMNRPTEMYMGLFGYLDRRANITDLGLVDVNITGGIVTGGLAAINRGVINRTFVTGWVNSTSLYAGLLVSANTLDGRIENSYAIGKASGRGPVGLLVGAVLMGSTVKNSYAIGNVSCSSPTSIYGCGGLVGSNGVSATPGGPVVHSFSNVNLSNVSDYRNAFIGVQKNAVITNSYFNNITTNPGRCTDSSLTSVNCTAIANDQDYFYNSSNKPIRAWDFTNVWKSHDDDYPTLLGFDQQHDSMTKSRGIFIKNSGNITIIDNEISENNYGIDITMSYSTEVISNVVCDNTVDIVCESCNSIDINNDGMVDAGEIASINSEFGSNACTAPDWCACADVNTDSFVNSNDGSLVNMYFNNPFSRHTSSANTYTTKECSWVGVSVGTC